MVPVDVESQRPRRPRPCSQARGWSLARIQLLKLRVTFGDAAVREALAIAQQSERRDQVSISAERQRHQREIRATRRTQQLRQRKDRNEPQIADGELPLPSAWR
jgi:hypothetical protein